MDPPERPLHQAPYNTPVASNSRSCWFTLARGKDNSLGEDDVRNGVILIA